MPVLERKWYRPTLAIFADNEPVYSGNGEWTFTGDYIYLTDDGRGDLVVSTNRIEQRQRMANGTLRTYHIADKRNYSINYTELPSRARDENLVGIISEAKGNLSTRWAAGQEILDWWEAHPHPFWALWIYDRSSNNDLAFSHELVEVSFSDISYNVQRRGTLFDHWTLNLSLEQV